MATVMSDYDTSRPLHQGGFQRIAAVDVLLGIALVLLTLDFARDFISQASILPTDLRKTNPALFFSRWITYFYAPLILFLSGVYVHLRRNSGMEVGALSRFLLIRGVLFIVIEFTLISFSWTFNFHYPLYMHLISVMGFAMLLLAVLVRMNIWTSVVLGVAMIAGHNIADARVHQSLSHQGQLEVFLHGFGPIEVFGKVIFVLYPIIPWVGVMALGYALGSLYVADKETLRRQILLWAGLGLTLGFLLLRLLNGYGDPEPWHSYMRPLYSLMSFLNVTKFPPSLDFLMMTLGPSFLVLRALDGSQGRLMSLLAVYGRVPLAYMVLMGFVLHILAVLGGVLQGYPAAKMMVPNWMFPKDFGYSLPTVYVVALIVLVGLYPICRWYEAVRLRGSLKILKYL